MTSRLSKRVGILVVVVASLLVGTSVLAQSPFAPSQNPIDAVLTKLDQIIEMLTPGTPVAGPVTLSTGLAHLIGTPDLGFCLLANVGGEPITQVHIVGKDLSGNTLMDVPAGSIQPGKGDGFNFPDSAAYVRCEFSFVGSAKDVRGTLMIQRRSAPFEQFVSLDAR